MIGVRESWEEPPKRKKVIWFKLRDGEKNRIAITSDQIVVYRAHFHNGRPYRCTGAENGCELCAMTGKFGILNHLVNIFNYDKKENEVWGFRKTTFMTLKEKKENNNGFNDITLIVKRVGNTSTDTTYLVDHGGKLPAEKEMEKLFEPIDLLEIVPDVFVGNRATTESKTDVIPAKEIHSHPVEESNPGEAFYDDGDSSIDDLLG